VRQNRILFCLALFMLLLFLELGKCFLTKQQKLITIDYLRSCFRHIHKTKLARELMTDWNFRLHFTFAPGLAHLFYLLPSKQLLVIIVMWVHLVHSGNSSLRDLMRLLFKRVLQGLDAIILIHVLGVLLHLLSILLVYGGADLRVLLILECAR
jgi:hypothetical protein